MKAMKNLTMSRAADLLTESGHAELADMIDADHFPRNRVDIGNTVDGFPCITIRDRSIAVWWFADSGGGRVFGGLVGNSHDGGTVAEDEEGNQWTQDGVPYVSL